MMDRFSFYDRRWESRVYGKTEDVIYVAYESQDTGHDSYESETSNRIHVLWEQIMPS
jgi:hypothetical protein